MRIKRFKKKKSFNLQELQDQKIHYKSFEMVAPKEYNF